MAEESKPTEDAQAKPPMTLRESIGDEQAKNLHDRLDEALDGGGQTIVMILNGAEHRISDAYMHVCERCVIEMCHFIVDHATHDGLLMAEAVAKMHGHHHNQPPAAQPPKRPGLEL